MKIPVLATGISGLVGSRVKELLADEFDFTDLSLETGVNITDSEQVDDRFASSEAKIVVHMAAKADVDSCEDDKILGEEGGAWLVNVVGTENIINAAKRTGKMIIYISTDFVFDGTKKYYTEDDKPNPINWYGYTKHEGEKLILASGLPYKIVRIAYPYRSSFPTKKDFVRRILEKLDRKEHVAGVTDHIFTPTFIDDIAEALRVLLNSESVGVYHCVGTGSLSTYDAIVEIAKQFHLVPTIDAVQRKDYFSKGAYRPFHLALKNDKIGKLGIVMKSFKEGLSEVKHQLNAEKRER